MDDQLKSLIGHFYHWESTVPDEIFLRQPFGDHWQELSFKEAGIEARKMTSYLKDQGIQKGDHIAILSKNCYHWILSDLAIMMVGAVSVPLYASLPREQLAVVLDKSDAKFVFVGKLDKWGDKAKAVPKNMKIISFPHYKDNAIITGGKKWEEVVKEYNPHLGNYTPDLDDLWTIKFTSGTTGTPKGVMHIHRTPSLIMANEEKTGWIGMYKAKNKRFFSFLPLNHVGERLALEVPAICLGGTISFTENLKTFAKNIQDTQPSVLFAVPRIWTKFYLGVLAKIPQKKLDILFKIPIVSGIMKRKLREGLGLKDAEIVATGAAITPGFLKDWYKKLGLHLIEAYGMTEVCGSITNGVDLDGPQDSVGRSIPFGKVKIHPDTGEILMATPYMMTGYYKDPEKTAEVLIDGWMYSGDRGTIDEQGYVRVVGRLKDAFKTSKGSYVTPNPMEKVLAQNGFIEQCCVVGLGIPQPLVIINLSEIGSRENTAIVENSLRKDVKSLNDTLAAYQKISSVIIDKTMWSEGNDLLTPTLKVKRGRIDDNYSKYYLNWYDGKPDVLWI